MSEPSSSQWCAGHAEDLASRGGPVRFEDEGVRLGGHFRHGQLIRYDEITHLGSARRGLAIGTRSDAILVRRRSFSELAAQTALELALRERVARLPDGDRRLARMAEIDRLSRRPARLRAIFAFSALCLAAFAFQELKPFVSQVGSFVPGLVAQGELWRPVTANFLHDRFLFPFHLGLNLLCILVIGILVERSLGSLRTVIVMGLAGLGSMCASALAGYSEVIGASGVAAGLAGALLCLELHGGERLPVWWRVPRRLLIAAVVLQAVLDWLIPFIAGAAHAGGFVAGYLATRLYVDRALLRHPAGPGTVAAAAGFAALVAVAALSVLPLVRLDAEAVERHALRMLNAGADASGPNQENTVAWLLVTETEPSAAGVHAAIMLAERAVAATDRGDPDLLDTLAEALFASGDVRAALSVIDEAISLAHGDAYFVEQRRRFTGERGADDRPEPPELPWFLRVPRSDAWPGRPPATATPGEEEWI